MREIDITGVRFGNLVVIKKNGHHIRKSGRKEILWECQCDCGNIKNVTKSNLQNGGTYSCGCVQKTNRYKLHRGLVVNNCGDYCTIELFDKSIAMFDTEDYEKVCSKNWHLNRNGYACNGKGTPMHRAILKTNDMDKVIHHINGNKLDNRKVNLAVMTRKEHTLLHHKLKATNTSREEAEKMLKGEER